MGGGLKDPEAVMSGYIIAASISVVLIGVGSYLEIRSAIEAERADSAERLAQQANAGKSDARSESDPEGW